MDNVHTSVNIVLPDQLQYPKALGYVYPIVSTNSFLVTITWETWSQFVILVGTVWRLHG